MADYQLCLNWLRDIGDDSDDEDDMDDDMIQERERIRQYRKLTEPLRLQFETPEALNMLQQNLLEQAKRATASSPKGVRVGTLEHANLQTRRTRLVELLLAASKRQRTDAHRRAPRAQFQVHVMVGSATASRSAAVRVSDADPRYAAASLSTALALAGSTPR